MSDLYVPTIRESMMLNTISRMFGSFLFTDVQWKMVADAEQQKARDSLVARGLLKIVPLANGWKRLDVTELGRAYVGPEAA